MTVPPRLRDALALASLFLSVAVVRVAIDARAELASGDRALSDRRTSEAVRHYARAAHLYLPGSPYTARAYARLEELARANEVRGQQDLALEAWRAVRASALATRWLVVPYRDRLDRANRAIAHLMARRPPASSDRGVPPARLEQTYLAQLEEDRAPEPAWVVVMGLGLALWLSSAFWAARRAWDDEDRPRPRSLALAGALVAFGLLLFFLGLARA